MSSNKINRVAIVGGTHGNELTGVYLIKKFEHSPSLVKRSTFETLTLLGNPRAFEAGTRYIDKDLNRSFSSSDLSNPDPSNYEDIRAREICQILGTRNDSKCEFIVDLHSTTSNMGLTIIIGQDNDPLILKLAAYLASNNPLVKIFRWGTTQNNSFLRSLCSRSIAIEVGAIAHGVLHPWYLKEVEDLVYSILDFLRDNNKNQVKAVSETVTIYEGKELVDYPRNSYGDIKACIHPHLMSKDFTALPPGKPMFLTFEGETITYQGKSIVYPTFVNEASYYEKGIAMCLAQKQQIYI